MRLSSTQTALIHHIIHEQLPDTLDIRLFGSRTDPSRRGGDIDLYVETRQLVPLLEQADLMRRLEAALQIPVDLIIHQQGQPQRLIAAIAQATSIPL